MEELPLQHQFQDARTDPQELNEVLDKYDLDEALEQEFNAIDAQFQQLEITYKSLLNTRRFLHNA
jgi:hypothetical protein